MGALPVARDLQRYFKQNYLNSIAEEDDFVVMVGIQEVVNEIDTVDLDLVVHGIDFQSLTPEKKKAFLTPFVKEARDGLLKGTDDYQYIEDNLERIRVTVSPRDSDDAMNVNQLIQEIEKHTMGDIKPNLQTAVKDEIETMSGIEFLSTWTPHAIHVSVPGQIGINDFAGDV